MSYPRYPNYKDSGVDWLGEVPEGWALAPLWSLFRRTKQTGYEQEELLSVYRDYGVILKSSRDDNFNNPSEDLSPYQLVVAGDMVINKMKAWQGSVAISEFRGIVSPAYFVYTATHTHNPKYFHYLLRSNQYIAAYFSVSKGIRINQWDLDPQYHSKLPVVLPSKIEQKAIAAFLDSECAKIDALTAEQENLIALLREKRQAVISHAVTKGLNPDAPMKDSGVEWLGEVPEHWATTRLKFTTEAIVDCPHDTPTYSEDGQFLVIRTADISAGRLNAAKMYRLEQIDYEHRIRRRNLQKGDIVYGREGERWGFAALVPEDNLFCLGQRMMQFAPSQGTNPSFLMWQLNSMAVYEQGVVDTVGATSPHVNVWTIKNYRLSFPPLPEQQAIVEYLNAATAKIDALIAEAEKGVALLKERKSALIAAAVTGKIDVRGLAPANTQEAV